ncbi:MAG: YicC/YloC family endoribonuclease [Myxococcota bacterium]
MTGFGRGSATASTYSVRCEVKSVNQKGFEARARLDRELAFLEQDVIATVRRVFDRGRFDVSLQLARDTQASRCRFDSKAAATIVDQLVAFAAERPDVGVSLSLGDLMRRPELFVAVDEGDATEEWKETALAALGEALLDLRSTRGREGDALLVELEARLTACESLLTQLEVRTQDAPARLREKLRQRLEGLAAEANIAPERLAQEAAILADRVDVREELARLAMHISHFRSIAQGTESVGRKLDFLCQELMREANTLGSKCNDAETAHAVVELKTEIERLREQVQNVE